MNLRFFYKNNLPKKEHEVIITSFANAISKIISLPPVIDVCLYVLEPNVYGGLDRYKINRIGINYNLSLEETPLILTHELIHVHQSHTGKLRIDRHGNFYWHGILYTNKQVNEMTYDEYKKLPWEVDVDMKCSGVFSQALDLVDK